MMRKLLLLLLFASVARAGMPIAGTGPNLPISPNATTTQIVTAVNPGCTASQQPWQCCTALNTGATCNVIAASTDAAPVWQTVYTGGAGATADCVSAGVPFACCTGAGAGTNCPAGSKITGFWLSASDATAHVVTCAVKSSSTQLAVSEAITTGTTKPGYASGANTINMISAINWPGLPIDSDGNPYILLASSSEVLQCRFATALTAGTNLDFSVQAYDF